MTDDTSGQLSCSSPKRMNDDRQLDTNKAQTLESKSAFPGKAAGKESVGITFNSSKVHRSGFLAPNAARNRTKKVVNAIITSSKRRKASEPLSHKLLTPIEFAELLKSCKVATTTINDPECNKPSGKSGISSAARCLYVTSRNRTKPSKLKWHHTSFESKKVKVRKSRPKSILSNTTSLAQAWLEQVARDLAAAETLKTTPILPPISPRNDPCLSASNIDEFDQDLPEFVALNTAKTSHCCQCKITDNFIEYDNCNCKTSTFDCVKGSLTEHYKSLFESDYNGCFKQLDESPLERCSCLCGNKDTVYHNNEVLQRDCGGCVNNGRDMDQFRRYRKRSFAKRVRQTFLSHNDMKSKALTAIPDTGTDAQDAELRGQSDHQQRTNSKMQGELNYFPQTHVVHHQTDPIGWPAYPNSDEYSADNILNDLFGESTENFLNVDSVGDFITEDAFSFLGIENNNAMCYSSDAQQYNPNLTQQQCVPSLITSSDFSMTPQKQFSPLHSSQRSYYSPVIPNSPFKSNELSSYHNPGCLPEELVCSSDTDSGIHSPGSMRSPPTDVYSWRNDLEINNLKTIFNCSMTSQAATNNERMEFACSPLSEREPQLLNMDDHQSYSAVPLQSIFPRDHVPQSTQKHNSYADTIKIEYPSRSSSWPTNTPEVSSPTESFQMSFKPLSSSNSLPAQTSPKKVIKRRSHSAKSRKSSDKGKHCPHLWEFIRDILLDPKHTPSLIKWEDRETGVFRFVQSDTVASMWGKEKHNAKMTYEKLSRAMRYYYNRGILERVDGRRLVYKFGPNAHGWQSNSASTKVKNTDRNAASAVITSSEHDTSDGKAKSRDNRSSLPVSYERVASSEAPTELSPNLLPSANVLLGNSFRIAAV